MIIGGNGHNCSPKKYLEENGIFAIICGKKMDSGGKWYLNF